MGQRTTFDNLFPSSPAVSHESKAASFCQAGHLARRHRESLERKKAFIKK
jgi:hypothetical protein